MPRRGSIVLVKITPRSGYAAFVNGFEKQPALLKEERIAPMLKKSNDRWFAAYTILFMALAMVGVMSGYALGKTESLLDQPYELLVSRVTPEARYLCRSDTNCVDVRPITDCHTDAECCLMNPQLDPDLCLNK